MKLFGKHKEKREVRDVEKHLAGRARNSQREKKDGAFSGVAPREVGKLDMVIAFDTTGSMARYIDAVRKEVAELVPQLFKDNGDLRLGIVAFGDYCDMPRAGEFGDAYQCLPLTANENDIIRFISDSRNTSGGDGDEFYELVIKKIVDETDWREGSKRSVLLISDADPHPLGYSFEDRVNGNQVDWRAEARKAADRGIKFDTVTINDLAWYHELSEITGGVSAPFHTSHKTGDLVRAAVYSRSSMSSREMFDKMEEECDDEEMKAVYRKYRKERMDI